MALSLGLYLVLSLPFTGTKVGRITSNSEAQIQSVFWMFASAELALQSARYFLEKGKQEQSGWIGMAANFLPSPWREYLLLAARYSGIWTTLVGDAFVVIFMLGAWAWWQGMAG